MGPALAPVFPPNNSAKSSHLNSISTPRVMLLTKGEKVWESQDLSFMSIQLRAFSYPPVLLSFQIFKFDFWIPHWFSMLFLALPTLFLWFSHFKDQLIACATWTTCPPLPYFWVKCLFSLFTNPLSTWMSPQSHPSKAICKPHILFSFLTLANPRSPKKGQLVAPLWSVCSLNVLWPWLRVSPVSTRAADGSYPKAPKPLQIPAGKPTEGFHFHAFGMLFLYPNKDKEGKGFTTEKEHWSFTMCIYFIYIFICLGFKYRFCHLLTGWL